MEQEENTGTDTAYAQSTAREQAKGAERKRLRHPRYAGECIKPPRYHRYYGEPRVIRVCESRLLCA